MINHSKSFKINTQASWHDKALKSCSTSLPGSDQVDGLPPAASTKYSCLKTPGRSDLFIYFCEFFEKIWIFFYISIYFGQFVPQEYVIAEAHARGFVSL